MTDMPEVGTVVVVKDPGLMAHNRAAIVVEHTVGLGRVVKLVWLDTPPPSPAHWYHISYLQPLADRL